MVVSDSKGKGRTEEEGTREWIDERGDGLDRIQKGAVNSDDKEADFKGEHREEGKPVKKGKSNSLKTTLFEMWTLPEECKHLYPLWSRL